MCRRSTSVDTTARPREEGATHNAGGKRNNIGEAFKPQQAPRIARCLHSHRSFQTALAKSGLPSQVGLPGKTAYGEAQQGGLLLLPNVHTLCCLKTPRKK